MFDLQELELLRNDTPGTEELIHFNNAGCSLTTTIVRDTVINYLQEESLKGGYETEAKYHHDFEKVYASVGQLINAHTNEIAYVESATAAWDLAFHSIPFKAGDVILTAQCEYASNFIAYLQAKRRHGVEIKVVPNDANGRLSCEALEDLVDERTKLIAITHIPTNGGLINPAEEVGEIARKHGVYYLLDACQSVGQMPIDVQKIGCDMLSATGRKFMRAPRGTGFLYVRKAILEDLDPIFLDLHSAEWTGRESFKVREGTRRFESMECNFANKLGFGVAVEYALKVGVENIWSRIVELARYLRKELTKIPALEVKDLGVEQCGIVSIAIPKVDLFELRDNLKYQGINTSVIIPSGTLLDMESRGLNQLLRASVHYYNTREEIDIFCQKLGKMIG
ncbi:aminotransferase class V-fold PLP-dependent enzyme [Xanthovirga aplysinae]|uniref:aminotransferase class V-fold PLP-dependent enzyme n=1 Tax=Xanthovirga aplysinae TaxID=2529853 RepID=UPI0012BC9FFC|nr:aminotransferase class V-fold PLP-dependent enzyme [Xanthovirga aplysinae]MTI33471.1 aminotransferase class V-fold PLP-dependent enzyme [Xanthovirga aplysinae]